MTVRLRPAPPDLPRSSAVFRADEICQDGTVRGCGSPHGPVEACVPGPKRRLEAGAGALSHETPEGVPGPRGGTAHFTPKSRRAASGWFGFEKRSLWNNCESERKGEFKNCERTKKRVRVDTAGS